jgi:choline dehydrogenase-like flavoprotein
MTVTRREFVRAGLSAVGLVGMGGIPLVRAAETDALYDLCVIGSGFAGIYIALNAASAGLKTIVIEAAPYGGEGQPLIDIRSAFDYGNTGEIEYPVNVARMIAPGGTSNHWSGIVNRLQPEDFRLHSDFGMYVDWPIGYEDLEPYYCQAEQLLSVRGHPVVAGAEPARSCDYPIAAKSPYMSPHLEIDGDPIAFFPTAMSSRDGDAVRLFQKEVPKFASTRNARLLSGYQTTRLHGTRANSLDHVEARSPDGELRRIRARRFVVAAGVIETPRLLLQSRSKLFPRGVGNDRDLVGRYFTAHPHRLWGFPGGEGSSHMAEVRKRRLLHRTLEMSQKFRSAGLNAAQFLVRMVENGGYRVSFQPEVEPRASNRVTLSESTSDRLGNPIPNIHFSYSARDRETREEAERIVAAWQSDLDARPDELTQRDQWRKHPSGTCRMGTDPEHAVVDMNNKVFGIDNLYVSGASVFPTSGTANPTLTVVAMALRLSDHLLGSV